MPLEDVEGGLQEFVQAVEKSCRGLGHVLGRTSIERGGGATALAETEAVDAEDALIEIVGQHPAAMFQQVGRAGFRPPLVHTIQELLLEIPRVPSTHQEQLVIVVENTVRSAYFRAFYHHVCHVAVVVVVAEAGVFCLVQHDVFHSRKGKGMGLVELHDKLVVQVAGAEHQHRRVFKAEGGIG